MGRKPRWQKWLLMPEILIYEAIALSLNIEPTQIKRIQDSWMLGDVGYPYDEGQEFRDRLDVLVANNFDTQYFPSQSKLSMKGRDLCGVKLRDFVNWATNYANWDIPEELKTLHTKKGIEVVPPVVNKLADNGDFKSDKLQYLIQAAEKFWKNATPKDYSSYPNTMAIEKWLVDKGYSQSLATKAASIIRPEWAGTGRRPDY